MNGIIGEFERLGWDHAVKVYLACRMFGSCLYFSLSLYNACLVLNLRQIQYISIHDTF
jgi:hypothetical protein